MDFSRKLLILLIVIIFIYIIFRLIIKRIQLKQQYNIEGYENENTNKIHDNNDCVVTIRNNLKTRLENIKNSKDNKGNKIYLDEAIYLKNYAIKSSLNSAYNGVENSTDMINYVLSRGCRFLDFEVYLHKDPITENKTVVVSVSKNKDADFLPLDSNLTISDALYYVNIYGFNSICPNFDDPVFIQLRPKIINNGDYDNNKLLICSEINKAIVENLSPLYNGKVDDTTPLDTLLGKFVVVMDTTQYKECEQNVNLMSNSIPKMITYSYQNMPVQQILKLKEDLYSSNVDSISQIIFEDISGVSYSTNVNTDYLFTNYSCQIIPMMFWNTGGELCNYETMFNECGGGIVPLAFIYQQLNKRETKYIEYPDPMFAFSIYGNQNTTFFILVACLATVGFIAVREMT